MKVIKAGLRFSNILSLGKNLITFSKSQLLNLFSIFEANYLHSNCIFRIFPFYIKCDEEFSNSVSFSLTFLNLGSQFLCENNSLNIWCELAVPNFNSFECQHGMQNVIHSPSLNCEQFSLHLHEIVNFRFYANHFSVGTSTWYKIFLQKTSKELLFKCHEHSKR